jgi:hypothetical protein
MNGARLAQPQHVRVREGAGIFESAKTIVAAAASRASFIGRRIMLQSFRFWSLVFLWSLVLGVWSFFLAQSNLFTRIFRYLIVLPGSCP